MAETRSILEQAERKADFDNGVAMLRAGRLEDARVLLEKVQAKQAGYPGLAEAWSELERKSALKDSTMKPYGCTSPATAGRTDRL